jgi:dihydroflavonol-4-reductase
MSRIAITGAAGHIGNNLVRALNARGERPRVVVHEDARALEGLDVERVSGDLMNPESLTAAFAGCERVFHLAAKISIDPREDSLLASINVKGPENVAAACLAAKVKRLVHFSSIHALSSQPPHLEIDETREPTSADYPVAYDRSKAAGEAAIRAAIARGLDAVIVNPTGVIGPFDYRPSPMGEVFLDLYHRRLPGIVEGGFNWVDVRDVVSAALAAADRGRSGERYLLSGHWMSVREVAALAAEVTGVRAPRIVSPMWLARASAPLATAFARMSGRRPLFTSASLHALRNHRLISHAKATRELGHQPRPLRDTITDIYAWFREAGHLERRAS